MADSTPPNELGCVSDRKFHLTPPIPVNYSPQAIARTFDATASGTPDRPNSCHVVHEGQSRGSTAPFEGPSSIPVTRGAVRENHLFLVTLPQTTPHPRIGHLFVPTTTGYAHVSTSEGRQVLDRERDALNAAGCERVFEDHASGAKSNRPNLAACLDYLRDGDILVVIDLDRLGRLAGELITLIDALSERGIGFRAINSRMDTTTPAGRAFLQIQAAFAEMERNLIRQRELGDIPSALSHLNIRY